MQLLKEVVLLTQLSSFRTYIKENNNFYLGKRFLFWLKIIDFCVRIRIAKFISILGQEKLI